MLLELGWTTLLSKGLLDIKVTHADTKVFPVFHDLKQRPTNLAKMKGFPNLLTILTTGWRSCIFRKAKSSILQMMTVVCPSSLNDKFTNVASQWP